MNYNQNNNLNDANIFSNQLESNQHDSNLLGLPTIGGESQIFESHTQHNDRGLVKKKKVFEMNNNDQ